MTGSANRDSASFLRTPSPEPGSTTTLRWSPSPTRSYARYPRKTKPPSLSHWRKSWISRSSSRLAGSRSALPDRSRTTESTAAIIGSKSSVARTTSWSRRLSSSPRNASLSGSATCSISQCTSDSFAPLSVGGPIATMWPLSSRLTSRSGYTMCSIARPSLCRNSRRVSTMKGRSLTFERTTVVGADHPSEDSSGFRTATSTRSRLAPWRNANAPRMTLAASWALRLRRKASDARARKISAKSRSGPESPRCAPCSRSRRIASIWLE